MWEYCQKEYGTNGWEELILEKLARMLGQDSRAESTFYKITGNVEALHKQVTYALGGGNMMFQCDEAIKVEHVQIYSRESDET